MLPLDRIFGTQSQQADEPDYFEPLRARDFAAAVPLIMAAVRQEDPMAMGILATLHAFGYGVEQNLNDSADWFRQAAVRGYPAGQAAFGACLVNGIGVPRNDSEAAYWLYRAAAAGNASAVDILSDLVLRNRSVIGEHFTEPEFMSLVRDARRVLPATQH